MENASPISMSGHALTPRYSTIDEVAANPCYPFTRSSLRHLIFQSTTRFNSAGDTIQDNGLGRAIIRVGRKVLIDLDEFDNWLDSKRQCQPGSSG